MDVPAHVFAKSLTELRSLSDEKLAAQHDARAGETIVGVDYYLNEITRRTVEREGKRIERLTWLIAALTTVNVVIVVVRL
jgi:hypothetical protein